MQEEIVSQEVKDWRNHPLTKNFFEAADDIIRMIEEQLTDRDVHVDKELRAYRIGLIEGLEALKTYNPEINPETGEVISE